ncbi:hypothetical protein HKX48_002464 [Thoreauomyces humboldtii]|nr:hypothetical protein HKX48_002464 [Thoreauomyces humboldtii]
MAASPSRDLAHFAGLEDNFCKDFFCCGVNLGNLHDLLQHFEECHVRVESDVDEDEDLPFEFESMDDMDTDISDGDSASPPTFSDMYLKSHVLQCQSSSETPAVALSDIYSEDYRISNRVGSATSAFDTSVIRKRVPSGPTSTRVKKVRPAHHEQNPVIPFSADGPTQMVTDMDIDEAPLTPVVVAATPTPVPLPSIQITGAAVPTPTAVPAAPSTSPAVASVAAASSGPTAPASLTSQSIAAALNIQPLTMPSPPSLTSALSNVDSPLVAQSSAISIDGMSVTSEDALPRDDRPYKCKVAGCAKAYKNPGGLKYHMQHGHCEDTGDPEMNNIIHKPYQCTVPECGKRYKNLNGLKYHIEHAHISLLGAC